MTNTEKLNIIIKTQFNNVTVGVTPTTFYDESYIEYKLMSYNTQCELSNNTKRIKISNSNSKLYLDTFFSTFKTVDFSTDIEFDITTLTADNTICSISTNSGATQSALNFRIFIRNTYEKGITIYANGWTISANYQFVINKKYVLSFTKKDDVYQLYIDGVSIGYKYSPTFTNNIITGSYYFIIGSSNMSSTSTSTSILNGNIYSFNYSIGPSLIHNQGFSRYGKNLISNLKFGNNGTDTSTTFYMGIETIYNAGVNWTLPTLVVNNGNLKLNGVPLSTNYTGKFTLDFNINSNTSQTSNIISYLGVYQLNMNIVGSGSPDPSVIVNTNTKSALDFENGIIDQIGTTVWTKEGTANVTSVNKIFGDNSFETKNSNDTLTTTAKLLTGSGSPYTIEYYFLYKGKFTPEPIWDAPIFTRYASGDIGNYLNTSTYNISFHSVEMGLNNSNIIFGKTKLKPNEINKVTMSYDGSSIRMFINDKLDNTLGTNIGFITRGNQPYRFFSRNSDDQGVNQLTTTSGLIDNINIFDGEARVVRDYDEHADKLVVDLAFDGENNSTKIVDNGTAKSNWVVNGNAKISTDQKFDGFSSLYLNGTSDYIVSNTPVALPSTDFTIRFEFNATSLPTHRVKPLFRTVTYPNSPYTIGCGIEPNNAFQFYIYNATFTAFLAVLLSQPDKIVANRNTKVVINLKGDLISLYLDNILVSSTTLSEPINDVEGKPLFIGHMPGGNDDRYFPGYIKNFKIYKGVAIIPENPTGKIQLDFDNNLTDKYNNSTWTNNGVTFDQVNSVKGYAAYFNGSNTLLATSNNSNLNFENGNFTLSYDFKNSIFDSVNNRYLLGNGIALAHGAFWRLLGTSSWKYGSFNLNYNGTNYGLTNTVEVENNYYNEKIIRYSDTLLGFKNDVPISTLNVTNTFNVDFKNMSIGTASSLTGGVSYFNGYIDNFKSIKDYQEPIVIDKPAVHLPLETNAINTGFTSLTVNSIGSPTYTTIDGKKCIKFEAGKYLTINSNNIFNLGTSSDFYIEFSFFHHSFDSVIYNSTSLTNNSADSNSLCAIICQREGFADVNRAQRVYLFVNGVSEIISTNYIILDSWNKVVLVRKNNDISIILNNIETKITKSLNLNFNDLTFNKQNWVDSNSYVTSYISNFKMFVGTSEIPETYNDKKVLDLDFKPTRKSYLFKDNNNKCVIHPVNITQRDYQDSQYCCTFNGTDQYLQLGKNDLFNFSFDDFIIKIVFKTTSNNNLYSGLITNAQTSATNMDFIMVHSGTNMSCRMSNIIIFDNLSIVPNVINEFIMVRKDNMISVYLNNELRLTNINLVYEFNLNRNNNTYIGANRWDSGTIGYFQGQIYSIQVLRNTSDLSLIADIPDTFNKTYTLTNGVDSLSMDFDNAAQSVRFINDENTVSAIINDLPLTVDKVDTVGNTDNLILFNDYIGTSSDIKMYDTVLTDNDTFVYDGPYDPEFGEVEIIKPEIQEFMLFDTGNYTVDMYVEGYRDHELFLYNDELQVVVDTAIDRLIHPYIEQNYLYEYSLNDSVTGKKYKIIDMGAPGDYTVLIESRVCLDSDFCVRVYRHDTGNFIGQYELNKSVTPYSVTIPNLDTTKTYDIMLFDKNTMVESRMMSDRSPTPY